MKAGISTLCIYRQRETNLVKFIEDHSWVKRWEIMNDGFHMVKPMMYDPLKNISKSYDIEFSIHSSYSGVNIAELHESLRKYFIKFVKISIEDAYHLEAPIVVVHPGNITLFSKFYLDSALKALIQSLKTLIRYASKLDVKIAIENTTKHEASLFTTVEDGIKIAEKLDVNNVGFCLDVGHALMSKSLESFLTHPPMKIIHLHAHENDGKNDEHLPPGSGKVDWNGIISQLKKLDFDGTLIIEQLDVLPALRAYDYLSAIAR